MGHSHTDRGDHQDSPLECGPNTVLVGGGCEAIEEGAMDAGPCEYRLSENWRSPLKPVGGQAGIKQDSNTSKSSRSAAPVPKEVSQPTSTS